MVMGIVLNHLITLLLTLGISICFQLWNSDHGHVAEAFKDSLKKLQLDYLDLYLVHFPVATRHTGISLSYAMLRLNLSFSYIYIN